MSERLEMWAMTDTAHVAHADDAIGLYDYTSVPVPKFKVDK